ncbi:glycosyltransferase [Haloarcula sp. 1CSR25-25]|uniref:glycosyltransferase n=1 Tax=Haloarcula sp. 1CSR25-25 TaxID=2862545 RepID=UPI002894F803|nr:glycosyltransferase [Haloarcula sp. 1CSR25-25]MDT3434238.1 glycosyltransferase [Haloarcula sp. 1CSR25-25]
MHVCLIFHTPFPNTFSTAIQETVRHLAKHVEVTVIAAADERETVMWNGATVHRLVSDTSTAKSLDPTRFGIKANRLVSELNDAQGIDIVHLHAFPALGAVLTTTQGIPVVADIRGTAVSNWVFELVSRIGLKLQRRLVDEVITVSEPVARHIFGPDPGVSIVPLGVDLAKFDPTTVTPVEQDSDSVTAVYVGHLHPSRELETLIEAVATAKKETPQLDCLIIGDGDARLDLEQYAADCGVADHIEFVGSVPHEEIPRWLVAADIGLAYVADKPQYRHQPPIKTVEYLAAGLPVVATNTEGNEQFVDETVGILTDGSALAYGDGLGELSRKYSQFSAADLRKRVERYDYGYTVENDLLPIYHHLTSQ